MSAKSRRNIVCDDGISRLVISGWYLKQARASGGIWGDGCRDLFLKPCFALLGTPMRSPGPAVIQCALPPCSLSTSMFPERTKKASFPGWLCIGTETCTCFREPFVRFPRVISGCTPIEMGPGKQSNVTPFDADDANVVFEMLSRGKTANLVHDGLEKLFDRKGS
jgi:hypothetical protein